MPKNQLQTMAKNWLPPAIISAIQYIRKKNIFFEGNYSSWESAREKCSGYNSEHILNKVLASTLKVKNNEAAYERDSVVFNEIEYSWPLLSSLMWIAARSDGNLNVLDFGGSLGSTYFQHLKFLRNLPKITWNVVEQSHYVQAGQKYIQDNNLKFHYTIDACLAEGTPNVVLLSSVLQYLQSPDELINILSSTGAKYLILNRTPISAAENDQLVIQHVPPTIYSASYPMWIFSKNRMETLLKRNWDIVTYIPGQDGYFKSNQILEFSFEGMLLEAKHD